MSTTDLATPPQPHPKTRSMGDLLLRPFRYPQTMTVLLLILALLVGRMLSNRFLILKNQLSDTSNYMEIGVMALAMTLIIISGNIDLSVASNLALTAVVCAKLFASFHVPMMAILFLAPILGGILGAFNGLLIVRLKLPSLTVTLGTLALYRGLAQVLAGEFSIGGFPDWFAGIDLRIYGMVPLPLIIFMTLAVIVGVVLSKSIFGRCIYAVGTNEPAARFSGLRVDRVKLAVFTISGLFAGIAALMMLSRLSVAKYDLASGYELSVITAVVLGGTDIFGGRGSVLGTVIALFLLGVLRHAMGAANVLAETQLVVTGSLLVASILLARVSNWVDQRITRLQS